jgi:hypothetical protein
MNDVRVHNFKEGEVDSTIVRCENGLAVVVKNRTKIIIVLIPILIVIIQPTSRL